MSDIDNARRLHKILDRLAENNPLDSCDISQLRATLPELPKQKTLKEIYEFVDNAAYGTVRNVWRDDVHGDLAPFLHEVSSQLEGLADAEPATVPALPAGMRLADHEDYGRCVVSPACNNKGERLIFGLTRLATSGATWEYVDPDTLTFIDAEPAKPAHPEFLETEEDYTNAPEGTVVSAAGSSTPRVRNFGWPVHMTLARRRVLRWGWGE